MTNQYFAGCTSVEEIKKHYRELAREHHPDIGGDTATMQAINSQYESALLRQDGTESKGSDGKTHKYYYKADVERAVRDAFIASLKAAKAKNVSVESAIIGTWVWVKGDTKPIKDDLKDAGFRWQGHRKAWSFCTTKRRRKHRPSTASLGGLAAQYGCADFAQTEEQERQRLRA